MIDDPTTTRLRPGSHTSTAADRARSVDELGVEWAVERRTIGEVTLLP